MTDSHNTESPAPVAVPENIRASWLNTANRLLQMNANDIDVMKIRSAAHQLLDAHRFTAAPSPTEAPAPEAPRQIGVILIGANGHPFAQLSTAYDENGEGWKANTPIYAAPTQAPAVVPEPSVEASERKAVDNIFSTLRYVLGAPDPVSGAEAVTPRDHYCDLLENILDHIASWPIVRNEAVKSAASLKAREVAAAIARQSAAPPAVVPEPTSDADLQCYCGNVWAQYGSFGWLLKSGSRAAPTQAPAVVPEPAGGEPVAWRREWQGDVSDEGNYIYASCKEERDEPLSIWEPLYSRPQQSAPAEPAMPSFDDWARFNLPCSFEWHDMYTREDLVAWVEEHARKAWQAALSQRAREPSPSADPAEGRS